MTGRGQLAVVWGLAAVSAGALVAACGPRGPQTPPVAYERYCARCHGDDGRGDPKLLAAKPGLDLVASEMVVAGELERIAERIARGHGTMPGFAAKLSADEITALAAYTAERFGPPSGPGADAPLPGEPTAEPAAEPQED